MGGALLVATPAFQFLRLSEKPGVKQWKNREIDLKTVVGGILFGVGWGAGGVCPGPGLVNTGLSELGAVWIVSMFTARWIAGKIVDSSSAKKD